MSKVAVILSGCGVFDGAEIHESVLVLLALDQAGVAYQCMAPDIAQMHVLNHITGEELDDSRNVLIESARIARGQVIDVADAQPGDYDAVIVPGGFGVAKNLSDFALKGADMTVNEDVLAFIQSVHQDGRPIGLACIAPVMSAKLFGEGVLCTIGNDDDVSTALESMGARHQVCAVQDVVVDEANRLVTTPAYMLEAKISDIAVGINKMVDEVLAMV